MSIILIILNILTIGIAFYFMNHSNKLLKFLRKQWEENELRVMNGNKEDESTFNEYLNSISIEMENGKEYKINPKTKEYEERKEA